MNTIVFIEQKSGQCGYQLNKKNLLISPPGKIRIARFDTSFWPSRGLGYYSDVYLHLLVRKCKHYALYLKTRKLTINNMYVILSKLNQDTYNYIIEFL